MKVSDYDARKHWIEIISLDRFNRLLQNDILKSLFKFWKSTKDFGPSIVWGLDPYELTELDARKYLAHVTGQNPNKLDQGLPNGHQRNPSTDPKDATGGSGSPEMERMDSDSRHASENDSINVGGKSAGGTMVDVEGSIPKLNINNVSMQEVQPISSDERGAHSNPEDTMKTINFENRPDDVLSSLFSKQKKDDGVVIAQDLMKVISNYVLADAVPDQEAEKRRMEAAKKAQEEHAALVAKIEASKNEKANQLDDFNARWKNELATRGMGSDNNSYDATDLKNLLSGNLATTYKNELAVQNNPNNEAKNSNNIDSMRTDYIIEAHPTEFLKLLNSLRSSPKTFSTIIKDKYLDKLDPMFIHRTTFHQYLEGKVALIEAEKMLDQQSHLPEFILDPTLCAVAHLQAKRQAFERKVYGEERFPEFLSNIRRFATVDEGTDVIDCNIEVQNLNLEDVIVNLFVDDGNFSRRNRTAISNSHFVKCGFGVFQKTKKSPIYCSLVLATQKIHADKTKVPKELLQDSGVAYL